MIGATSAPIRHHDDWKVFSLLWHQPGILEGVLLAYSLFHF